MRLRPLLFLLLPLLLFVTCRRGSEWPRVKERIREEYPDVPQISVETLRSMLEAEDRPLVLLDVRSREEFEVSHLEGAIRVEPGVESPELPAGATEETTIVTYCSVGYRSAALARRLLAEGFPEVYNLEGSIFEWANAGLPVYREGREVREVHPFDEHWGRLLDPDLRSH